MTKSNPDLKELMSIPGVGKSIAQDLIRLGITKVSDLKDKDPHVLYNKFCDLEGKKVDRCLLYVFRCAVYFASTPNPEPDLLLWWNWKDSPYAKLKPYIPIKSRRKG